MSKIVVVGGGAAGLLCAAKSAEKGNDVIIIEKMNRCGRKLMITGKGRCNVTNASFELCLLYTSDAADDYFWV